MKTLSNTLKAALLVTGLSGAMALAPTTATQAQVSVSINVPAWAPQYDDVSQVQYYYIPDIEAYYDVFSGQYVYLRNGMWIRSYNLPPAYSSYDLYSGFVVVLDYGVRDPWYRYSYYRNHYPRYYYRDRYHPYDNTPNNAYYGARGYNENKKNVMYSKNAPARGGVNNTTNVPTNNGARAGAPNATTNRPNNVNNNSAKNLNNGNVPQPNTTKNATGQQLLQKNGNAPQQNVNKSATGKELLQKNGKLPTNTNSNTNINTAPSTINRSSNQGAGAPVQRIPSNNSNNGRIERQNVQQQTAPRQSPVQQAPRQMPQQQAPRQMPQQSAPRQAPQQQAPRQAPSAPQGGGGGGAGNRPGAHR